MRLEDRELNSRYHSKGQEHTKQDVRLEESIKEDLEILRASSWIQKGTRLIGLKYDTHSGLLHEIQDLRHE